MMGGIPVRGDLTEVELAIICDRYKVLPSWVMEEDAYLMRRVFLLNGEMDRIRRMKQNRKGGGSKRPPGGS